MTAVAGVYDNESSCVGGGGGGGDDGGVERGMLLLAKARWMHILVFPL